MDLVFETNGMSWFHRLSVYLLLWALWSLAHQMGGAAAGGRCYHAFSCSHSYRLSLQPLSSNSVTTPLATSQNISGLTGYILEEAEACSVWEGGPIPEHKKATVAALFDSNLSPPPLPDTGTVRHTGVGRRSNYFVFPCFCVQVSLSPGQHPRPTSILMPLGSVTTRPSTPWVWTALTPLRPASLPVHLIMFPGEGFAQPHSSTACTDIVSGHFTREHTFGLNWGTVRSV